VAGAQFRNTVSATLQCDFCVTTDNNLKVVLIPFVDHHQ
jgi:hypothetical protein